MSALFHRFFATGRRKADFSFVNRRQYADQIRRFLPQGVAEGPQHIRRRVVHLDGQHIDAAFPGSMGKIHQLNGAHGRHFGV